MAIATKKTAPKKAAVKSESPAPTGGWFQVGMSGVQEELSRQETRQKEYDNAVRRFWFPVGEKKDIIFVDGNHNGDRDPFNIREHSFNPPDRKMPVWKTCLRGVPGCPGCPYCDGHNGHYFLGCYTVVDMSQWTSKKDGAVHKNELALLGAKPTTLKVLRTLAETRNNDLTGCMFRVSRSGDKSPGCGDVFDFIKRVNLKDPKVLKELGYKVPPKVIDYRKVLEPLAYEDAVAYMRANANAATSAEEIGY